MADNTAIEWADATVNAVNGCSLASPGCTNCYAMKLAGTRMKNHPTRAGLTLDGKAGPVWTGEVRLHEPALLQPLRWQKPRRIFWNAHGDLFHPNVPDEWIDRVFAVCALTPQHTHMILTKRSARMREYFADGLRGSRVAAKIPHDGLDWTNWHWPLANVWLGVSVEDQARADERIPDLLATPAAVRFISAEPLLGQVVLGDLVNAIDWVIVGGESGPGARPMNPLWARFLRAECSKADVPFLFKQWGEWAPLMGTRAELGLEVADLLRDGTRLVHPTLHTIAMVRIGKKRAGRLLDGFEHNGFPEQAHA